MSKGEVRQITVIATTLERRGAGHSGDPVRVITQYWSPEGELLAEVDPCEALVWARQATVALLDIPEDTKPDEHGRLETEIYQWKGFCAGWYAARDTVYRELTGKAYGA